jgi:uncharacterized membrane protein
MLSALERYDETFTRSVAKLLLTRAVITISQIFVGYYVTGTFAGGVSFTLQSLTLNAIFYLGHERVWNLVSGGRVADDKTVFKDTWGRTIYKMVTWRLFVSANNFLVPYILTGSLDMALLALSMSSILNTAIHFVVERWTNCIRWGRRIVVDKPCY